MSERYIIWNELFMELLSSPGTQIYPIYDKYKIFVGSSFSTHIQFKIGENNNLILAKERHDRNQFYAERDTCKCNYNMGHASVDSVIYAYKIFMEEGREKFTNRGLCLGEILQSKKKYAHTKSAKIF